jgi:hypothetical protein
MMKDSTILTTLYYAFCLGAIWLLILTLNMLSGDGMSAFEQEMQAQNDLYCEMVELSILTSGDLGWPDYNNNYDEVCK